MTGTTTEPTNEGQTEDEDDGIIITGGPGISNEPEQTTEDEQEDDELTEEENTSEPEQTEETNTEPDTEESVEAEEDMVPEENSEDEASTNDSEAAEETVDTDTETNTNPEMTESEPEAVESEAEQTEDNEEVHTEEPTGADPDGTVDVAGDEEETVPEEPDTSQEDTEAVDTEDDPSDDTPETTTETETSEAFSAIIEGSTIANALDSVSVLVDECKIRFKPDEMTIRAVDPANVGMVGLRLSDESFESYKGGGEENVIGINLGRFEDIIGMANSGDLVQMELNERTRKLEIHIDGLSYTLALIDPDSIRQEPDIPNLDLPAEVVAEGRQINRGITAADMVSDHITLRVDEQDEAFFIEAEGDTDDVDLRLSSDDLVDINAGPANSLFSLDYLKDMNKAIPKTAEVTMEVGEEFPVKLHYTLDDGRTAVTYMLAPRIQSD
jgi:proliferating cell nuclear antigen